MKVSRFSQKCQCSKCSFQPSFKPISWNIAKHLLHGHHSFFSVVISCCSDIQRFDIIHDVSVDAGQIGIRACSDDKDSTFIASYPSSIPKIEDQVIGVVLFGERGTKNPSRHVNPDAISISAVYSLDDCDMWWTKVVNISSKWTKVPNSTSLRKRFARVWLGEVAWDISRRG